MRLALGAGLLLAAFGAAAQTLHEPQRLEAAPLTARGALDPAEAPMLAAPSDAGTLRQWYQAQKRPPLVVYFDRKLEHLPAGWRGTSRLVVEETRQADGKEKNRQLTVGVQHNTEADARRPSQFALLLEQSLQQELTRQGFVLRDGTVLHRRDAAARKEGDLEYGSLQKAVRFVFEVELLAHNGELSLVGRLKDIHSGEIAANVRVPVEGLESNGDIDRATRALVKRLVTSQVS